MLLIAPHGVRGRTTSTANMHSAPALRSQAVSHCITCPATIVDDMVRFLSMLILFYRRWISPIKPQCCRYLPSCSEFAAEAVEKHGAWRGSLLALRRLLSCHPLGGHGLDPVPERCTWLGGRMRDVQAHQDSMTTVHCCADSNVCKQTQS